MHASRQANCHLAAAVPSCSVVRGILRLSTRYAMAVALWLCGSMGMAGIFSSSFAECDDWQRAVAARSMVQRPTHQASAHQRIGRSLLPPGWPTADLPPASSSSALAAPESAHHSGLPSGRPGRSRDVRIRLFTAMERPDGPRWGAFIMVFVVQQIVLRALWILERRHLDVLACAIAPFTYLKPCC
jgi:hypothetical protein